MVSGIPCIPLSGTTGLAIGQDFASILNYTAHAAGGQCPFAAMSYLSLATVNGTIPGLANATDYGSGVEWVDGLTEQCLTSAVQLGIWMVDYYRDIPSGKHDDGLALLSTFIKQHSNPVYLRIGYEFDSSANRYDPGTFKEAYRYIARYFRSRAVSNAALVWHASGFEPRHSLPHMAWFPGADVVDWCGVSLFQQPYGCGRQSDCASMIHADSFARQCTKLGIPLMIAESTPFGGILDPVSGKAAVANRAGYVGDSWSQWFEPVLSYIERHDVRLWSYINCDWDSQPMWQKEHAPGIYWGDSRIEGQHCSSRTMRLLACVDHQSSVVLSHSAPWHYASVEGTRPVQSAVPHHIPLTTGSGLV